MASFKEETEKWANDLIAPYIKRIRSISSNCSTGYFKEINDPVWGTINISSLEVYFLNSPLLQRLRYIKQLGVVHWVYPGAVHTRFEHSLGVLYQVDNLISCINSRENSAHSQDVNISSGLKKILRLTALLHDIGHGFMSHVSEYSLSKDPQAIKAILNFADEYDIESPKLSEIASIYIINSEIFLELMSVGLEKTGQSVLVDERTLTASDIRNAVSDLLLGKSPWESFPMIHRLISGPFDCDKLDYLKRDARMTGIPEVVDISRLSRKVVLKKIPKEKLPEALAERLENRLDINDYNILGIKSSGMKVLDELLVARLMLFSKVYKHKKVLAVEAMVKNLLHELLTINAEHYSNASICYLFDDDSLLKISEHSLAELFCKNHIDSAALKSVCRLSSALRDRNLFVCALSFCRDRRDAAREQVCQQGANISAKNSRIESAFLSWDSNEAEKQFIDAVCEDIRQIISILNLPYDDPKGQIALTHVDPAINDGEIGRAIIIGDEGDVFEYHSTQMNIKSWIEAYAVSDTLGYMFTGQEYVFPAYIAVERWLSSKLKIEDPSRYLQNLKISSKDLNNYKMRLMVAGYYKDAEYDICPEPDILRTVATNRTIKLLSEKFSRIDLGAGIRIDQHRIRIWLKQFQDESFVSHALKLLDSFLVIDRESIRSSLRDFFDSNKTFAQGYLCPLGSPKDSSSIIAYYAHDLQEYGFEEKSIESALKADMDIHKPIVFIDDFLGSGGQVEGILKAWFNDKSTADLLEEGRDPLSPTEQSSLRERKIAFYFSVGWKEGEEKLRKVAKSLGLTADISIGLYADKLPSVENCTLKGAAPRDGFIQYLADIGEQLLRSAKPKWDETKYKERCLGYGNKALLISTTFNVPTHTVTAIWRSGCVNGRRWMPLIPRREKR